MRDFIRLLGRRKWLAAGLAAASIGAGLCESALLALIALVSASLIQHHDVVSTTLGGLHLDIAVEEMVGIGLGAALFRLALGVVLAYLPARIAADIQAGIRRGLFSSFIRASWTTQSRDAEGQLQALMTSQVWQVATGALSVSSAATSAGMLVVLCGSAFVIDPLVGLVVLSAGTAFALALRPLNRFGSKQGKDLSTVGVEYVSEVHAAVRLAEESKVFGAGEQQVLRITTLVDRFSRRLLVTRFLIGLVPSLYQGLVYVLLLGGLWVVWRVGLTSLPALGAIVLMALRASTYAQQLQASMQAVHQTHPFLVQIRDAEETYARDVPSRGDREFSSVPALELRDVSYTYPSGERGLSELSLRIPAGEVVGIVGPTGAGKSTLVHLILGLRDPSSGSYLVGGIPAAEWSQSSWARAFSYVRQDPQLLRGTVADNIRFFRPLEDSTVERAARLANIHDEVTSWQNGYATVIDQVGDAVSGGEKQRIALARSLAGDPWVLVLDEPTSALDVVSERHIRESLAALKGKMTIILVAHRMSTLAICDRVVVLRKGRIDHVIAAGDVISSATRLEKVLEIGNR